MTPDTLANEILLIDELQYKVVTDQMTQHEYLDAVHELFFTGRICEVTWKQGLHFVALPLADHTEPTQKAAPEEQSDVFVVSWSIK